MPGPTLAAPPPPPAPAPTYLASPPPAGAVLLGFTRDGCHLVSYTTQPVAAADGQEGYSLQLWSFAPGARCRRLWSVPLFRCRPGLCARTLAAHTPVRCRLAPAAAATLLYRPTLYCPQDAAVPGCSSG